MVEIPKNNEVINIKPEKNIVLFDPNDSWKIKENNDKLVNKEKDPDTVLQEALKNMDKPENNEKGKKQLDYIKNNLLLIDLRNYFDLNRNTLVMDNDQLKELNKYMFLNIPSSTNRNYFDNWTYILDLDENISISIVNDIYKQAKGETLSVFNSEEIWKFNQYRQDNNVSLPNLIGNQRIFAVRLINNIEDSLKNKK